MEKVFLLVVYDNIRLLEVLFGSLKIKFMLPVSYVSKHEILTYDESVYYFDSSRLNEMDEVMEKNKFIKIWDSRIAVSSIKTVRPAKQEISILELLLKTESEDIKRKVRSKIIEREKENKINSEWAIKEIIESFKK